MFTIGQARTRMAPRGYEEQALPIDALLLAAGLLASPPAAVTDALQGRSKVLALRTAKVGRVLAAAKAGDSAKLEDEAVLRVPYFLGHDRPHQTARASPFDASSLDAFVDCDPSRPAATSVDWLTITWACPETVALPWRSTSTAFKFDGVEITEIRTIPGPPVFVTRR